MEQAVYQRQEAKSMESHSTTPIGIALGIAIDLFRRFPSSITEWCLKSLCIFFAVFILAPFVLGALEQSSYGFINPKTNTGVTPLIYGLCVMFAEPSISFIIKLFEIILPGWVARRLNNVATDKED